MTDYGPEQIAAARAKLAQRKAFREVHRVGGTADVTLIFGPPPIDGDLAAALDALESAQEVLSLLRSQPHPTGSDPHALRDSSPLAILEFLIEQRQKGMKYAIMAGQVLRRAEVAEAEVARLTAENTLLRARVAAMAEWLRGDE